MMICYAEPVALYYFVIQNVTDLNSTPIPLIPYSTLVSVVTSEYSQNQLIAQYVAHLFFTFSKQDIMYSEFSWTPS